MKIIATTGYVRAIMKSTGKTVFFNQRIQSPAGRTFYKIGKFWVSSRSVTLDNTPHL